MSLNKTFPFFLPVLHFVLRILRDENKKKKIRNLNKQTYGKGSLTQREKKSHCRRMGYSFRTAAMVLLYAPTHTQSSTYHGLCYIRVRIKCVVVVNTYFRAYKFKHAPLGPQLSYLSCVCRSVS